MTVPRMSVGVEQHRGMPTPEPATSSVRHRLLGTGRRRLAALAAAIAVAGGATAVVVVAGSHPAATGSSIASGVLGASTGDGGASTTSSPPATAAPTPEPTGSVSSGPGGSAGGTAPGGATPTAPPAPASTPAPAAGPPACTSGAIGTHQTLSASAGSFEPGQSVTITATIENLTGPCTGAPAHAGFAITRNGTADGGTAASRSAAVWRRGDVITDTYVITADGSDAQFTVGAVWPGSRTTPTVTVTESASCSAGDFSLVLATSSGQAAGQPVPITSTITNTSGHSCPLAYSVSVTVTDGGGKVVFAEGAGPASTGAWAPGQAFSDHFSWDSTGASPGTYTVTVTDTDHHLTAAAPIRIN